MNPRNKPTPIYAPGVFMALMITDTQRGSPQRMRCAALCRLRMQAKAVFVAEQEGPWHS